jgi:hypothetical protein
MENASGLQLELAKFVLAMAFIVVILAVWLLSRKKNNRTKIIQAPLLLSGLWLTVAAYVPYIVAGQSPDSDSMRGAAFGVVLILLAGTNWIASVAKNVIANVIILGTCVFWIGSALIAYADGIASSRQEDLVLQNVVITLKEQVPDVAEQTNFVFINSGLGRTGCIGFVNMLYDRSNLHCIHLLSGDAQEGYTRTEDGLVEEDGRLWPDRFIILTFDDQGLVTVLDQLDQDDYENLPVTWEAKSPLVTNRSLIYPVSTDLGRNFDLFNYIKGQYYSRGK